jgi:hypothetical protein
MNQQQATARAKHPTETAEYWLRLARDSRAFAKAAQRTRSQSVESVQIYLREADEYERKAAAIAKASS